MTLKYRLNIHTVQSNIYYILL